MSRHGIPVVEGFSKDEISQKHSETFVYREGLLRNDAAAEAAAYIKDKIS